MTVGGGCQVGEAVKTAEQADAEERGRMAALEKGRLQRIHSGLEEGLQGPDAGGAAPKGGFAARRHRQQKSEAASTAVNGPSGQSA